MYHLDQAPPLIFADAILQPLVPIVLSVRPTRDSESPLQICNLAGPFHALSAAYLPVTTSSFRSRLALSCASRCAAAALAPYLNHTHSYKACIRPVSCTRVQNRSTDATIWIDRLGLRCTAGTWRQSPTPGGLRESAAACTACALAPL